MDSKVVQSTFVVWFGMDQVEPLEWHEKQDYMPFHKGT